MKITEQIHINASPDQIFELYKQVDSWSSWDPRVLSSCLSDGLVSGSVGKLRPKKGPEADIKVTEVTHNQSFTIEGILPLCKMIVAHEITPEESGVNVVHSVSFEGPLSRVFSGLVGQNIEQNLPQAMRGLKDKAEAVA